MGMRKRVAGLSLASLACVVGLVISVGSAGASGVKVSRAGLNGTAVAAGSPATAGTKPAPACYFTDDSGNAVSSITIPTRGGSDAMYWMQYISNGHVSKKVTFALKPPAGSNQNAITTSFNTDSSSTDVTTPVGITYWSGATTSGTWTLVVTTNTGAKATCSVSAS
jgi:hypothetical protein